MIRTSYSIAEVNFVNPHEVLNIPITATRNEIRAAYRALARRWHPDRFMEGPERDWANEKMAQINAAYRDCLNNLGRGKLADSTEDAELEHIRQMIDDGNYSTARKMLMRINTRRAEWNYLFGAVLYHMAETEKALIYLSVAAHQQPNNRKYALAFQEAQKHSHLAAKHSFASLLRKRG